MANIENDLLYKLLIAGKATTEDQRYAAEWIARLHAALSNLSNAAAIVFSKFEPKDGPGETAKALLRMELSLKD